MYVLGQVNSKVALPSHLFRAALAKKHIMKNIRAHDEKNAVVRYVFVELWPL